MEPTPSDKTGKARCRRGDAALAGVGVGLFAFVLYLLTLAPTVLYYTDEMKDSSVLQATAYTLGIGHPTGYPTYTILTHLFTYLPFGDAAYRVNLASAVFGALAVAATYVVGTRLGGSIVTALVGALALGTSQLFWSQAVIAEVYTLHVLFLSAAILVLLLWRERRQDKYLLLAAFMLGLAMTHHLTSGLLLPSAAAFVLLVEPRKALDWKVVFKGAGVFLVALVPYAYLPIRARMDPAMNARDPSNWERFEDLVTGGEFSDKMWAFGIEELPERLEMYLDHLVGQFPSVLLAAGIVGFLHLLVRDRAAFALLALPFGGFLFYALEYDIEDIHYYFIPTYALLAVWASVGLGALLRGTTALTKRVFLRAVRAPVAVALPLLALCVPLWNLMETYRTVDMSEDREGRRIIEIVAREAGPNATIIHHRSPLQYMQLVEGRREDVQLWSFSEPQSEEKRARAEEALHSGRVYELFPSENRRRFFENAGYRLAVVEEGMLYRVVRGEGPVTM